MPPVSVSEFEVEAPNQVPKAKSLLPILVVACVCVAIIIAIVVAVSMSGGKNGSNTPGSNTPSGPTPSGGNVACDKLPHDTKGTCSMKRCNDKSKNDTLPCSLGVDVFVTESHFTMSDNTLGQFLYQLKSLQQDELPKILCWRLISPDKRDDRSFPSLEANVATLNKIVKLYPESAHPILVAYPDFDKTDADGWGNSSSKFVQTVQKDIQTWNAALHPLAFSEVMIETEGSSFSKRFQSPWEALGGKLNSINVAISSIPGYEKLSDCDANDVMFASVFKKSPKGRFYCQAYNMYGPTPGHKATAKTCDSNNYFDVVPAKSTYTDKDNTLPCTPMSPSTFDSSIFNGHLFTAHTAAEHVANLISQPIARWPQTLCANTISPSEYFDRYKIILSFEQNNGSSNQWLLGNPDSVINVGTTTTDQRKFNWKCFLCDVHQMLSTNLETTSLKPYTNQMSFGIYHPRDALSLWGHIPPSVSPVSPSPPSGPPSGSGGNTKHPVPNTVNMRYTCPELSHSETQVLRDNMTRWIGTEAMTLSDDGKKMCHKGICTNMLSAYGTCLDTSKLTTDVASSVTSLPLQAATPSSPCGSGTTNIMGTCCTQSIQDDINTASKLPRPRIGLYHGGIVGAPATSADCYKAYLKQVIDFVTYRKIDVMLVDLQSFTYSPTSNEPSKFLYYDNPQFLAENLLAKLPPGIEVGVVAYVRPKDSEWDFQYGKDAKKYLQEWPDSIKQKFVNPVAAVKGAMKGGFNKGYDVTKNACDASMLESSTGPCPVHMADDCKLNCAACPTCDKECVLQNCKLCAGDDNNPCKEESTGSPCICQNDDMSMDKCVAACPTGCPNIPYQVVSYIRVVNAAAKAIKGDSATLGFLSFDGEDAGSQLNKGGMCQLQIAANDTQIMSVTGDHTHIRIGYAKALNAGTDDLMGTDSFVMPESYWFMNETWNCLGDDQQDGKDPKWKYSFPSVCTTQMSYRVFKDRPSCFLRYLLQADAASSNNLKRLQHNINFDGPSRIWSMFSLENLSGSNAQDAGGATTCLARHYFGGKDHPSNVCGTFDGFSHWSWEAMEAFLKLFADYFYNKHLDTTQHPHIDISKDVTLVLYESQFIPPSWLQKKAFDDISTVCKVDSGGAKCNPPDGGSCPIDSCYAYRPSTDKKYNAAGYCMSSVHYPQPVPGSKTTACPTGFKPLPEMQGKCGIPYASKDNKPISPAPPSSHTCKVQPPNGKKCPQGSCYDPGLQLCPQVPSIYASDGKCLPDFPVFESHSSKCYAQPN